MAGDRKVRKLREARAAMIGARERILRSIEGRSEAELRRTPAGGGWSPLEVLAHIGRAEHLTVKAFEKRERGEPVRIPARCWWYRLPIAIAVSGIPIPAPKLVRPKTLAELDAKAVIEGLELSRRGLLAFADRLGEAAFSDFVLPHFLLGRFDGITWFTFIGRHETKHLGQLERLWRAFARASVPAA